MPSDISICSPESYSKMTSSISQNRASHLQRWIFDIINDKSTNETIIHATDSWVLCVDKHNGSDERYLVIFRDLHLVTIRELRQQHVVLLKDIQAKVCEILQSRHPHNHKKYLMYFHYMPSVFQLHLHVCLPRDCFVNSDRIHRLHHVIRNLQMKDDYYAHALIIIPFNRFVKMSGVHTICKLSTVDKPTKA